MKQHQDENNTETIEVFFYQWALYEKVLQQNYMFHQQMYQQVTLQLQHYIKQPFSLLDLGCGDARFIAQSLQNLPPINYTGVDLSQIALDSVQTHFTKFKSLTLIKDDLSQFLQQHTKNHDVVLSSYSLHHLSLTNKKQFFKQVFQRLKIKQGILILIDVFRQSTESREDYLHRWWKYMENDCENITKKEQQYIKGHMSSSDYPETLQTHIDMAKKAGFSTITPVYVDPPNLHQLIICQ